MSLFGRRQPDSPSHERSAEERERARLEREARRAEREGRPAPPPPALRDEDPFDVPQAENGAAEKPWADEPADLSAVLKDFAAEKPWAEEEDEPRAAPAAESAPPVEEPDPPPPPVEEPPPTQAFAIDSPTVEFDVEAEQPPPEPPAPVEDRTFSGWEKTGLTDDQPAVPASPAPAPEPAPAPDPVPEPAPASIPAARTPRFGDEDERPVPPKRVQRRTLPPPPPPPGEGGRRGRPRRGRVLGILALVLIAGAAWLVNTVFQPFKGDGGKAVTVRVPSDSTADEVGDILAEKQIVDSAFLFTLRARLDGANLQAGTYRLKEDSSYGDAIDALKAGPPPPRTIRLTIPEGRSRREAAPLIEQAGLEGSYLQASEKPTADFSLRRYGAPRGVRSLEGFLFPATYELDPGASARRLVAQQLDAFRSNIREVPMRRARARNLSTYEILIIASMVEREASLAKERRLISAVIHNRLRDGMPLGIDATIRFATRNWSRPLKVSELNIDSPYNTRRRTGLPPGPIGSPGLASIKAAANPANVDYLYYVVKPSGDGAHNFSSTDAEFQKDVEAYKREQERRGGKSPAPSQ